MLNKQSLGLAAFVAGFAAMLTQLVFLRELFHIFEGNEMAFGIVLGNWMLLMGLGAFLGRYFKKPQIKILISLQILQALLPIITILILRANIHKILPFGVAIGMVETFLGCFLILLPFCLTAGCFLVVLSQWLQEKNAATDTGKIYCFDNIGSVFGGILFSVLLIYFSNHFIALYIVAFLHLIYSIWIAHQNKQKSFILINACILIALTVVIFHFNLEKWSLQQKYKSQNIIFRGQSPYGDLVVTQSAGQYNFIQNGVPFFSTGNLEQIEESVHYPMSQRPDAKNVLLVGGGVAGTACEILKYHSSKIDYVELDPLVIHAAGLYVPENFIAPCIRLFSTDGRLFVQHSQNKYDVIILGAPEPVSFQFNRFYTREFFQAAKRAMKPDGVLSFSISGYQNYLDQHLADLIGVTHATLHDVFKNVLLIPGYQTYFLASDGDLTLDIAPRLKNISTKLINENYLRAILTPDRLADLHRATANVSVVNKDFTPVLYFYHLKYWMSRFHSHLAFWLIALSLALIFYIRKLNVVSFAVFSTGLASSALEMILLCGFQILYGNVYHRIGIILTSFMLGMSLGSFFMLKSLSKIHLKQLIFLMFCLAIYTFIIPTILKIFESLQIESWMLFSFFVFLPAFWAGLIFPLTAKLFEVSSSPASSIYGADYIGACLGFLLVTTLLLPMMGLKTACGLTAFLCITSALALSGKLVKQKAKSKT